MNESSEPSLFSDLGLPASLLKALNDVGYESATPIQAAAIPPMLEGKDVLGQAQTGTGKTAAFALPILTHVDVKIRHPQALVLTPTRELAIQVAEAFQKYAAHIKDFHVSPIYGGQNYDGQLRLLKRGIHVVVGTPGRVMDHLRRGTLNLDALKTLVLDEADEMLRMGFIDDVKWILEQTPPTRQMALFSATMPKPIRRIADRYLKDPITIMMKSQTATAERIRQRYWMIAGTHKMDALTRILEVEDFDGMLVFVRTKTATIEIAERLEARGFSCAPLNGDIPQNQRERTVERLKKGAVDVIVATDVAARGLDVDRLSHVINYDVPYDTESYIHRIGRTGRAGRVGDAIIFVAPRERRMLRDIEAATRQTIERMELPTSDDVNNQRIERFKQRITDTIASDQLDIFRNMVLQYQVETEVEAIDVAAALAQLAHGDAPFLLPKDAPYREPDFKRSREKGRSNAVARDFNSNLSRYRIEVGRADGLSPKNIVGAIANEAGISSRYIGHIQIEREYSTVDLPADLPDDVMAILTKLRVAGKPMRISADKGSGPDRGSKTNRPNKPHREARKQSFSVKEFGTKKAKKAKKVKKDKKGKVKG